MKPEKKITVGCRVRLQGVSGWWRVDEKKGTSLACTHTVGRQEKFMTTEEDQVIAVSNKRTKGKAK